MVNADQIRAARALLGWSQEDLATRTSLTSRTIINAESGEHRISESTLQEIERVIEDEGITFVTTPEGVGVFLKKR